MGEKNTFKEFFNVYGIKFISSTLLSLIIFLSVFFSGNILLISAVDGLFYGFVLGAGAGIMSFITNLGFFDVFAYSFIRFRNYVLDYKDKEKYNYDGTYDYSKSKELKRRNTRFVCLSYFASSLLFLIPCIITFIIFKINI